MTQFLVFFILLSAGHACGVSRRLPFPIDENTNYDGICKDLNVTINFRNLDLHKIEENFVSSPIITCLDLSDTNINSVGINAFNNLPSLRFLNMSRNPFNLNDIFSSGHLNLETLILDDNRRLNYYNAYLTFNATYPKMKRLFIRNPYSRISFKPGFKNPFPSLTHLYLSGSRVFEDKFEWLPNTLEYLDLSGHELPQLNLRNLHNLKYLILSKPTGPTLKKLQLKNLINLKYLSATLNMLEEVTVSTFAELPSLIFLDISNNKINHVQRGSFDHMKNLQLLNLSSNYIESIEEGTFDRLENLEILSLDNNQISEVKQPANELRLKVLYLNCNRLKTLAHGSFVNMPHLESLYLHGNEISYVEQDAFVGLSELKILTLANNSLRTLPINWMLPIVSIKQLDLTGNLFYDFEELSLDATSAIEHLYMSTQLKVIKSKSLESVPKNLTINVDPNYVFSEKCFKKWNGGMKKLDV